MSSYFDYLIGNIQNQNVDGYLRGTCNSMCPQDEIELRLREKLVHELEKCGANLVLVKRFGRPAADVNKAVPSLLRPYPVLLETVHYLLFDVTKRNDVSDAVAYDFITDRLRAVRQDMTIQKLPPEQCIVLLEPMVRFHVYYGYKLANLPVRLYNEMINKKFLLECLKWVLSSYDSEDLNLNSIDKLVSEVSSLNLKNDTTQLTCDRVLMEALYILCNLEHLDPMRRYYELSKDLKRHLTLKLAYQIAAENLRGNFVRMSRLLEKLCPLTYCAMSVYLPSTRQRVVMTLVRAYKMKYLTIPPDVLATWLHLPSGCDAKAVCAVFGIPPKDDVALLERIKANQTSTCCTAYVYLKRTFTIDVILTYRASN